MLLIAKKKGWFVIAVWGLSFLGCYFANELVIKKYLEIDPMFVWGTAMIISGIITFIIKPDRRETDKVKRKEINEDNTFFFLSMGSWSYLEILFGTAIDVFGILKLLKVL